MGTHEAARIAALAGCSRGVESVCTKPAVSALAVAAALGCVPIAVRPTYTDTRESLRERLGRSNFLDGDASMNFCSVLPQWRGGVESLFSSHSAESQDLCRVRA